MCTDTTIARARKAAGESIRITYGGESVVMTWNGAEASAPICVDGVETGYQTADARHRTSDAVRLACSRVWGSVYETRADADAAGHGPDAHVTIWDDVEYETIAADRDLGEVVYDYDTGARVDGTATGELARASREAPSGAVAAYLEEGAWHPLDESDVSRYRQMGVEVRTVYLIGE